MSVSSNTMHDDINTNDDKNSVMSSVSITNMKIECPECKKELQTRSMFKHIRTLHPEYFASMFKVWKSDDFKELIDECKAFPVEWEYKNDFDETEFKNIWGCLGCNNTYTSECKANAHCKLAKCKKDHIKGMKDFLKQEQKDKEKRNKQERDTRFKYLNRTADQIFNDTRIIINHYSKLTDSQLRNDFIKYMSKLNPTDNVVEQFAFNYDFNITLSSDKKQMEQQENLTWRKIEAIERTYKEALAILYYNPNVITDEEHYRLKQLTRLSQSLPKLSYN